MSEDRAPREADSRESESRVKSWKPPEVLPQPEIPDGYVLRWMRYSSLGDIDHLNVGSYRREGWEIVSPADMPDVAYEAGCDEFSNMIEIGGLVLVKLPKEIYKQREAYYLKQANMQAEAVDNSFLAENDPRMPLFRERSSKASRSPRG